MFCLLILSPQYKEALSKFKKGKKGENLTISGAMSFFPDQKHLDVSLESTVLEQI